MRFNLRGGYNDKTETTPNGQFKCRSHSQFSSHRPIKLEIGELTNKVSSSLSNQIL